MEINRTNHQLFGSPSIHRIRPILPPAKRSIPNSTEQEIPSKKQCTEPTEPTSTENTVQDFRNIPIIPTIEELKNKNGPILMKNIVEGNFKDVDNYLEVNFRLLREDFLCPLRQKILELQKTPESNNESRSLSVFEYHDVRITDFEMSQDGLIYNLRFNLDKFDSGTCENCTKLAYGSLLCMSHDNFRTAVFASVVDKRMDDLRRGLLKVKFETEFDFNKQRRYTILESQAFFEAYRHVLKGLQSFNDKTLPLQNYLVHVKRKLEPPSYLTREATYSLKLDEINEDGEKIEFGVQVSDINTWPAAETLDLDESQRRAMHLALSSSLAIIQGPPGTGKTHVGLKIIEALLNNSNVWQNRSNPILVVCFTNHALDQFLEGILKFTNRIIRVGSRSTSAALANFTLREALKGKSSKAKRQILALKKDRADAERTVQIETQRRNLARTRVVHESLMEKVLNERDLMLLKSVSKKGDFEPPFSFLGAWLGLIKSDFVSDEELKKLVGDSVFECAQSKDSNRTCVESPPKEVENEKKNVYNAKTGIKVRKYIKWPKDWAVIINVGINCEKLLANEKTPTLSGLGNLAAEIVKKEFWKVEKMKDDEVGSAKSAWDLNLSGRWRLYRRWKEKFLEVQEGVVKEAIEKFAEIARLLKKEQNSEQAEILRGNEIVGMTTTCAARYLEILKEIGPKIVIVEEAAEVLESHITTCMSKSTQHLILIGDHQQLRPGVNVHELAKNYNLDVSLFERMIRNKVPFETLQLQHRMRPEISSLLVPHIYDSLQDHPIVQKYPNIRGLSTNVFFLEHDIPEEAAVGGSTSHANLFEAQFLSSFCHYLLQQQYRPSQITILTPYSGQLGLLRKLTSQKCFEGVKVTVVDNFQGEENDIILISFARSNETNIGFLRVHNRVNVALSRAKLGLFCVGNFHHYSRRSPLWRSIVGDLDKKKMIGGAMTLVCETHRVPSVVRKGCDIKAMCPLGGCRLTCNQKMECGHYCPNVCHTGEHSACEQVCNKVICENQHKCPLKCNEECKECEVLVTRRHVTCDHVFKLPCSVNISEVKCMRRVEKELPCGHRMELYCCTDPSTVDYCEQWCNLTLDCGHVYGKKCKDPVVECQIVVHKILPCGHPVVVPCFTDVKKLVCELDCPRNFDCGHACKRKCHEPCGECEELVLKQFSCGHTQILKCCTDLRSVKCEVPCERKLGCGHNCKRKCFEECGLCKEIVDKTLPCNHKMFVTCCTKVNEVVCIAQCARVMKCGHNCKRKCSEVCRDCAEIVEKQLPCGHKVPLSCCVNVTTYSCIYLCRKILKCGHRCTLRCCDMCVECLTIVIKKLPCGHEELLPCSSDVHNVVCQQQCLKTLPCSHRCDRKCTEECQSSCTQPVQMVGFCGHEISVPCHSVKSHRQIVASYCNEPCNMFLPCGHNCVGTCGKCRQGRLHIQCNSRCNRKLICGHVCFLPCAKPCNPCNRIFTYLCDHIRNSKCGSDYEKCGEKCNWVCPHYKCSKKCGELCDRPRCDRPCDKKLRCGHACIGLCGEKCPKLCTTCDSNWRAQICDSSEETDEAKFIELHDCGHNFEVRSLDRWMEKDEVSIGLKGCPKCGTAIGRSNRYANIIKTQLEDIEKVKCTFRTRWTEYIRMKREAGIESTRLNDYFPFIRNFQDRLCGGSPLNQVSLTLMASQIKVLMLMAEMKRNSERFKFESAKKLIEDEITALLPRVLEMEEKINEWEWKNIVMELKRSELIAIYLNLEALLDDVMDFQSASEMERVEKILDKTLPFNDGDVQDVTQALMNVHRINVIEIDFFKIENFSVIKTKDMECGHWFKCCKGHVYFCNDKFYVDHQERCSQCN